MQKHTSNTAHGLGWFEGFSPLAVDAGGVTFRGVIGGSGPAVLLLHGYPQTHVAWRRVANTLARTFTVVVPDLPGYGASRVHDASPRWTKRRVGDALIALMDVLGHSSFAVVGHDRGARAGYRLALDHPGRVHAFASLTVIPTLDAFARADMPFAMNAWHWFFLAQPADLPERMLSADPDAFLDAALIKMTGGLDRVEPAALEAYRHAFRQPTVRLAICEDYRSAVEEDLRYDSEDRGNGRRLACPVLVLWPERKGSPAQATPVDIWRQWASDVQGHAIPGGHLQPEDSPEHVLAALLPFLTDARPS
ncbi:alpha/beta fold hydrolase [Paraburkholderia sp. SIMBA_053]|uniref:alpha/beta fold hydrolase n=1 Tax=Paraburkholderia sp. SIMBA_053 TaxID=3085794 RepID=UPI0039784EA8